MQHAQQYFRKLKRRSACGALFLVCLGCLPVFVYNLQATDSPASNFGLFAVAMKGLARYDCGIAIPLNMSHLLVDGKAFWHCMLRGKAGFWEDFFDKLREPVAVGRVEPWLHVKQEVN